MGAIRNTSSNVLTQEEQRTIAEIEEIRTSLEQSHQVLTIHDYGAGTSNKKGSGEASNEAQVKRREIGDICKSASKNQLWCSFLFQLIRQYKPKHCVEMGTCLGISAAYISSALRLNGSGSMITLEGSPEQAEIARATFRQLGLENVAVRVGRFQETLVPVMEEMKPVGFVFVDGHHDEVATREYFNTVRPYLDIENVMVFDDIRWSDGMKRAWQYVSSQSQSYGLGSVGLCIDVGAADTQAGSVRRSIPA